MENHAERGFFYSSYLEVLAIRMLKFCYNENFM